MQLYDATVRLQANPMHEVPKSGLTAPEVLLLQFVHGEDAVVRVRKGKMDKRSHEDERLRLSTRYGDKRVADMFGPGHTKLPIKLDNVDFDEPAETELTDDDLEALTAPDPE